jgi:hypothetical protein
MVVSVLLTLDPYDTGHFAVPTPSSPVTPEESQSRTIA